MKARSANLEPSQEGSANTNRGSPPHTSLLPRLPGCSPSGRVLLSPSCWSCVNAVCADTASMSADRVIGASAIAARNAASRRGFCRADLRRAATSGRFMGARNARSPLAVIAVFMHPKKPWLIRVQQHHRLPLSFPHCRPQVARSAANVARSWPSSPAAAMAGGEEAPFFGLKREGSYAEFVGVRGR